MGSRIKDTNKKLPKPNFDRGDSTPEYPWVHVEQDTNGRHVAKHANPEKPDESFHFTMEHNGQFKNLEIPKGGGDYNGQKIEMNHDVRSLATGGASRQTNGHEDFRGETSHRQNIGGGALKAVVGNMFNGIGKNEVKGVVEGLFRHVTGGSSADNYSTVEGDHTQRFEGNRLEHVEGDHVTTLGANKYEILNNGEYGIHVQNGNMDTMVENGKFKIECTTDEIIVKSPTKITLKVGDSYIEITPSNITIKSQTVTVEADVTNINSKNKGLNSNIPPLTK